MKFFMLFYVGLATLIGGVFASVPFPGQLHWENTTVTTSGVSTSCGTGLPSTSLSTASKAASAEPSIYTPILSNNTIPANVTVEPIHWHLYDIRAFAHKNAETAHYTFKAAIHPSNYTVVCYDTVRSNDGKLDGVDDAKCRDSTRLPPMNVSIPIAFHFAWRPVVNNTLGQRGNLLVIKSNSPGSAHSCPHFPYDACWAQGLYWIPEKYIKATDSGYKYIGPESVHLNGTYCKTGMPECIWSEYLY